VTGIAYLQAVVMLLYDITWSNQNIKRLSESNILSDVICPAADDHSKCCKEPLSLKPKLENVSQLQRAIKHEKDVIKRKFHSMSLASLASVFSRTDGPSCSTNESTSLLKTLLLVSAATVAIMAVVRGMSSSQ
jgi:hypothetical protein